MCVAEKCCYFIPLNIACIVLGITNFIISTILSIASMVCYFTFQQNLYHSNMDDAHNEQAHFIVESLNVNLKMDTVHIILSVTVLVGVFWMMFSVLLILGIIKSLPSLVLSYFTFGIILTMLFLLTGLLFLLNGCWWLALLVFFVAMINIHFLVVVHTVYEAMQRGKDFRLSQQQDDYEETLVECFNEVEEQ